jgi:hypothetical protein
MSLYFVARQVMVYTMLPNTQSHRTMPVNIYVSTPASQCVRIHVSTNVSFEHLFWVQILVTSISIVASADHSENRSAKMWQAIVLKNCNLHASTDIEARALPSNSFFYVHICHHLPWFYLAEKCTTHPTAYKMLKSCIGMNPLSFLCDGALLTCFHPPGSLCWRWTLCHLRPPEQAARWVNGLGLITLI